MQDIQWTKPYYGIQHTQKDKNGRSCTVQDNQQWAALLMRFEGCGFSPNSSAHDSVEQAREAGERWLASFNMRISGGKR